MNTLASTTITILAPLNRPQRSKRGKPWQALLHFGKVLEEKEGIQNRRI
jgi:hypothetical protein